MNTLVLRSLTVSVQIFGGLGLVTDPDVCDLLSTQMTFLRFGLCSRLW